VGNLQTWRANPALPTPSRRYGRLPTCATGRPTRRDWGLTAQPEPHRHRCSQGI